VQPKKARVSKQAVDHHDLSDIGLVTKRRTSFQQEFDGFEESSDHDYGGFGADEPASTVDTIAEEVEMEDEGGDASEFATVLQEVVKSSKGVTDLKGVPLKADSVDYSNIYILQTADTIYQVRAQGRFTPSVAVLATEAGQLIAPLTKRADVSDRITCPSTPRPTSRGCATVQRQGL